MVETSTRFFEILSDYTSGEISGRIAVTALSELFYETIKLERQLGRRASKQDRHYIALLKMAIVDRKRSIMDDFLMDEKLIDMEAEEGERNADR